MQFDIQDIEIKSFSELNADDIQEVLASVEYINNPSISDALYQADEWIGIFDEHRVEHGVAPGGIYIQGKGIVGIGGFYYLEETGLYEVVCNVSPRYKDSTPAILNHLVLQAFDSLMMDKICARAVPQSFLDRCLADSDFVFSGERIFMKENNNRIWNYYELEDESKLVSAENRGMFTDNSWDALF